MGTEILQTIGMNELAKIIHENAVAKGFVEADIKRPIHEHVALLHSEISELLEENRQYGDCLPHYNEAGKPLGVPSELADIVIRAFDFAYEYGFEPETYLDASTFNDVHRRLMNAGYAGKSASKLAFTEWVCELHAKASRIRRQTLAGSLFSLVIEVVLFAAVLDYNLNGLVVEKMNYNFSRPFKHGKHF